MFHLIDLLDFMKKEASTFERITLKFLSILCFRLQKKYINGMRYYYDTLKISLFNQNHELSMEELRHILQFPIYGSGDVPEEFDTISFWCYISDDPYYIVAGAKVYLIQNPFFWYAQKALTYTLFGRGDSSGVATQ